MQKAIIREKVKWNMKRNWPLHLMLVPAVLLTVIFAYIPMGGAVIAFQDFKPWLGFANSPWVGLKNFARIFELQYSIQVMWNTLIISGFKIIAGLIAPFVFSLLLNEVVKMRLKRMIQTMVYLPHFLSWVILGGILIDMLSVDGGIVNRLLQLIPGVQPVFFLGDGNWFRATVVISHAWKEFGFGAIIYLAALAGINPSLYEAALMDGASRWKQTLHITIPGIMPITIVIAALSMRSVLNAGFDQIFNLYNPLVYSKGDIIDTYVYRISIINGNMGFGTAVGLFKSVIGMLMIIISYRMASVLANYRIF